MRAQILHLDGPLRGRTVTYDRTRILFGTSDEADVRYTPGLTIKPRHALIWLAKDGSTFLLRALEGEIYVNHKEVTEIALEDGDLLVIGRRGPKLRFRIHAADGPVCKPLRQMIRDARDVGSQSGVFALTQSMRRDLVTHSSRRLKLLILLLIAAIGLGIANLGGWLGARREAQTYREEARETERRLEELRERLRAVQREQEDSVSRAEVARLREEMTRSAGVVDALVRRDEALQRILETYSRGVCLIHGIFTLMADQGGGKREPVRGPRGKPLELEYTGSGFLVHADGSVLTNRHVAEPWWNNPRVAPLLGQGITAEFVMLEACFPGRPPVRLDPGKIRTGPAGLDVALLSVPDTTGIPVLPLFEGEMKSQRGQRVVLLGYPTGVNALLARAEPAEVTEIMAKASDLTGVIRELAARQSISPIITQGALNEIRERKLVYDAETTVGGSGGPLFGPDGTVIGVNFAVTRDFGGSNFGIPIRYARALLP